MDNALQSVFIEQFLESSAGEKIQQALNTVASVQQHLAALDEKRGDEKLTLLKIGTVFQIFLIDKLASGKRANELTSDDWKDIASKVSKYAILEADQCYSEFIFSLYANYIDLSANVISKKAPEQTVTAIQEIAKTLRSNGEQLRSGSLSEPLYVEACLWLSLEAMIKLLCVSLTAKMGEESAQLTQAVAQLAFEYGRYVLFAKEQKILTEYLQNQRILDERLRQEYQAYLAELQEQEACFRALIDDAFSPDIRNALRNSADLARAAGVREKEILRTMEDVDSFFLE